MQWRLLMTTGILATPGHCRSPLFEHLDPTGDLVKMPAASTCVQLLDALKVMPVIVRNSQVPDCALESCIVICVGIS